MQVAEVCNREVIIITGDESVKTAADLMRNHHVRSATGSDHDNLLTSWRYIAPNPLSRGLSALFRRQNRSSTP